MLRKKTFKNIVGKEQMLVTSIFSFSHNVFYFSQNKFKFSSHIYFVCRLFQIGLVYNFVIWWGILLKFNPFSNKTWFLHVCCTSLLETLWEKEILLVMSNFSFSQSAF